MNLKAKEIISLIKQYAIDNDSKTPTIKAFALQYSMAPASIIRTYGSWNKLLKQAGLKINKANKFSNEQLLGWLKSHPNTRYNDIPTGIRNKIEQKYQSISNARKIAGLKITDWRSFTKNRTYIKPINAGRPIEYTQEEIISKLQSLAITLGRPPRAKDITKKNCGFTKGAILCKFNNLNAALQASSLPIIYSYQEYNKLIKEFEIVMMNIKISSNDIPLYFKIEQNELKPTFIYNDHCEIVMLKRSDVFSNIQALLKYKDIFNELKVWFLVDDSLDEDKQISMSCVMEFIDKIKDKNLANYITKLRQRYDEISRNYVDISYIQLQK